MSTRSGKRIHGTVAEEGLDNLTELRSVRKTRKQQKENCEVVLTEKKRKNYVRYPSEENIALSVNNNGEDVTKTSRKSRRNTLKEQNLLITDSETSNDERKPVRVTRRTKKFDTNEALENEPPIVESNEVIVEKKKGKKKKTKKSSIEQDNVDVEPKLETSGATKKKSNKRKTKKRSDSIVVEDICPESNKSVNKSSASIDSFHSAAGSPDKDEQKGFNGLLQDDQSPSCKKQKIGTVENEKSSENVENSGKKKLKTKSPAGIKLSKVSIDEYEHLKRQSDIDNTTFDKVKDSAEINNIIVSFESINKKKSSIRESVSNMNDISSTPLDTTFEMKIVPNKTSSAKKRKSSVVDRASLTVTNLDATYEKDNPNEVNKSNETDTLTSDLNSSSVKSKRKSSIKNSTYDKIESTSSIILDSTYDKEQPNLSKQNLQTESRLSKHLLEPTASLNSTYEKQTDNITAQRKSSIKNTTYDKIENISSIILDSTYDKDQPNSSKQNLQIERRLSKHLLEPKESLNSTYDKQTDNITAPLDATFDKMSESSDKNPVKKCDSTFDKQSDNRRSSLISSDTTDSKSDFTDDNSRISITSDESKEKIMNTTPVLIESSVDEIEIDGSMEKSNSPLCQVNTNNVTPLKREGTFNTDKSVTPLKREDTYTELKPTTPVRENTFTRNNQSPLKQNSTEKSCNEEKIVEVNGTPSKKGSLVENKTPLKREGTFTRDADSSPEVQKKRRQSLPSPGCTPFPLSKSASKNIMNLTRSIEKSSSLLEIPSRTTKVMFCSPVNNPAVVTQMKGKVIKSNLKGSNKSFVFDESVSDITRPARKRSYTQSEADEVRRKRKRLTDDQQHSVERLSRPRTASATGRLQDPGTPTKKPGTPSKSKPDKVPRTKLPNFAALHQKQFEKMESLDECQERKAKRARQLLTPTAPITVLGRSSPKETQPEEAQPPKKTETPKKTESIPGYSRFGFKLNLDVNPFSFPKNTEIKPNKPKALKRQATLPSLTGTTNIRRNLAKQTIMREKSFTEKRNVDRKETRTVIKGVRTNRRFELQMKMRNINEK